MFLFLSLPRNNVPYQNISLIASSNEYDVVNSLVDFKQRCYSLFDLNNVYGGTLGRSFFSLLN